MFSNKCFAVVSNVGIYFYFNFYNNHHLLSTWPNRGHELDNPITYKYSVLGR